MALSEAEAQELAELERIEAAEQAAAPQVASAAQVPFTPFGAVDKPITDLPLGGIFPQDITKLPGQIAESITGAERATPETRTLPEIGDISLPNGQLQIAAGLLASSNIEDQKAVIQDAVPSVKFEEDAKGNTLVDFGEGKRAVLNKPGLSFQDTVQFTADVLSFVPAARIASIGTNLAKRIGLGVAATGGITAAKQATEKALGAPEAIRPAEIAITGALGAILPGKPGQKVAETIGGAISEKTSKVLVTKEAKKLLSNAAPTVDGLKDAARGVYKELDNLDVTINSSSVSRLGRELRRLVGKEGFDPISQKEVVGVLDRFPRAVKSLTNSDLNIIRNAANNAAQSIKPAEARLGKLAATQIDNFIKKTGKKNIAENPVAVNNFSKELRDTLKKEGFDPKSQTEVAGVLNRFPSAARKDFTTSELDIIRKSASNTAKSSNPTEARLGRLMVERIDGFLDNLGRNDLSKFNKDIGAKYRDARQLWRRAKKSEIIQEAFDKSKLQASGFENGIRTQFRSILNNPKKRKGFTSVELNAMRSVVKGGTLQNIAKALGKFGVDSSQASGALLPLLGAAGGGFAFSGPGAIAVPIIGTVSKKLAQILTKNSANGADLVVRAGSNGLEVVKAYMKITKPGERNAKELAQLLLRPDVSLKGLKQAATRVPKSQRSVISDAVFLVGTIKAAQPGEE